NCRAYRWNEDGLAVVCNRYQNICLAVALWNERDSILKERLFGLNGRQGNHGEDVKEYYWYLDCTPTYSYLRMLYRYPQVAFPYGELVSENKRRGRTEPEFELADALYPALAEKRYFDVYIEYAKVSPEDLLGRIRVINCGTEAAPIHVLPHIWFRNVWSWWKARPAPRLWAESENCVKLVDRHLGDRWWYVDTTVEHCNPLLLFTENETNLGRVFGVANGPPYAKDGINEAVVDGRLAAVNPGRIGSKAAAHFCTRLTPGDSFEIRLRFTNQPQQAPFHDLQAIFNQRREEADAYYRSLQAPVADPEQRMIQRQAWAGLLWNKQFYHYNVELWLKGDPAQPPPPSARMRARNADWTHIDNLDVLSMPDKWEYPWYAAWDLAFHTLPMALVDPAGAKQQLILLLREWYMHPNGQLPAYEWEFGDVNPPVHAWACWRVYQISRQVTGTADTTFLERVFLKLLLNFTWWVNRKDPDGKNVFQGGFLGLDNIGVFDRSKPFPLGGHIDQADGTAWMAMYCLNMLTIALELAQTNHAYEDVATKFFEHYMYIANAFYNNMGGHGVSLWDDQDGFFYDVLHLPDGSTSPLRIRSIVGLIPLLATLTIEPADIVRLPEFRTHLDWFLTYRPWLVANVAPLSEPSGHQHYQLGVVGRDKLERILARMFAAEEFLSPYGLRSLSRAHLAQPYEFSIGSERRVVKYEPGESQSNLFGGNSNWRGPVWFPLNYLLIEALDTYHHHYGDSLRLRVPSGTGPLLNLGQAADNLALRLLAIFRRAEAQGGRRPVFGEQELFRGDPNWDDNLLFYEYFNGDTGAGCGASHHTGWTALIANLIARTAHGRIAKSP
ncbi:MAG: MGH1-like glycoside hydrolase domain-containing protein, partial [Anaerolineae bacterium]